LSPWDIAEKNLDLALSLLYSWP